MTVGRSVRLILIVFAVLAVLGVGAWTFRIELLLAGLEPSRGMKDVRPPGDWRLSDGRKNKGEPDSSTWENAGHF